MPLPSSGIIVVEKPIAGHPQQSQKLHIHSQQQAGAGSSKLVHKKQQFSFYEAAYDGKQQHQQHQHPHVQPAVVVDPSSGSSSAPLTTLRRTNTHSSAVQQFNIKHNTAGNHQQQSMPQQQQPIIQHTANHKQQYVPSSQIGDDFIEQVASNTTGNIMYSTGEVLGNQQIFKIVATDGNVIIDSMGGQHNAGSNASSKVYMSNLAMFPTSKQSQPASGTGTSSNAVAVAAPHHQQPSTINFVNAKGLPFLTTSNTTTSMGAATPPVTTKPQKFSLTPTSAYNKASVKQQQQQHVTTPTNASYIQQSSMAPHLPVPKINMSRNIQQVTRVQPVVGCNSAASSSAQQPAQLMMQQQPPRYNSKTTVIKKNISNIKMSQTTTKVISNPMQQGAVKTFISQPSGLHGQQQQQLHYPMSGGSVGGPSNAATTTKVAGKSKLLKQYNALNNNSINNTMNALQQQAMHGSYTANPKSSQLHQQPATSMTKITKVSNNKYIMQNHHQQTTASHQQQQQQLQQLANLPQGTQIHHKTIPVQHQHSSTSNNVLVQQQMLNSHPNSAAASSGAIKFVNSHGTIIQQHTAPAPTPASVSAAVTTSTAAATSTDDYMLVNGTQMTDEMTLSARILQSMAQKSFNQRYQQQQQLQQHQHVKHNNMPPPTQHIMLPQHVQAAPTFSGASAPATPTNLLLSPKEYAVYNAGHAPQLPPQHHQQAAMLPAGTATVASQAALSPYSGTTLPATMRQVHSAPGSRSQSLERKALDNQNARKGAAAATAGEYFKINVTDPLQTPFFDPPSENIVDICKLIPLPKYNDSNANNLRNVSCSNSNSSNSNTTSNNNIVNSTSNLSLLSSSSLVGAFASYAPSSYNNNTSNEEDIIGEEERPVPVFTQDVRLQTLHALLQDHTYANPMPTRLPSDFNVQQLILPSNSGSQQATGSSTAAHWSLGGIGATVSSAAGQSTLTSTMTGVGQSSTTSYSLYDQQIPRLPIDDDAQSAISNGSRMALGDIDPGEETETAPEAEAEDDSVTRCICDLTHDDGYMICCDRCSAWQHVDCMGIDRQNIPDEYLCEMCQPRTVDKMRARALQIVKRKELQSQMLLSTQGANAAGAAAGTALGSSVSGTPRLLPNDVHAQKRLAGISAAAANAVAGSSLTAEGLAIHSLQSPVLPGSSNALHTTRKGKVLKKTKESGPGRKSKKAEKLAAAAAAAASGGPGVGTTGGMLSGGKVSRKDAKKTTKRKSKNSDGGTSVTAAEKHALALRQWIENYELAVTNHYSPELRARLHAINKQPSLLQSILNTENRALKDCGALDNRASTVPHAGGKILVSNLSIGPNSPILELRGKYMLTTQYKTQNGSINMNSPPPSNYLASVKAHKIPGPFIFFYQLPGAETPTQTRNADGSYPTQQPQPPYLKGPEICVDTRTYGNEARFVRRSCRPNAEIQHLFEKGTIHLFIVSLSDIRENTEITVRHEPHDLLAITNKRSNNLVIQPTSTPCACGLSKDCIFGLPQPLSPASLSKGPGRKSSAQLNGSLLGSSIGALQLTVPYGSVAMLNNKKKTQAMNRNRSTSSSGDSNMGLNSPNVTQINVITPTAMCGGPGSGSARGLNVSSVGVINNSLLTTATSMNSSNTSSLLHDSGICTSSSSPSVSIPSPTTNVISLSPTQQQLQQQQLQMQQQHHHQQQPQLELLQSPTIPAQQPSVLVHPMHQQIMASVPTPLLLSPVTSATPLVEQQQQPLLQQEAMTALEVQQAASEPALLISADFNGIPPPAEAVTGETQHDEQPNAEDAVDAAGAVQAEEPKEKPSLEAEETTAAAKVEMGGDSETSPPPAAELTTAADEAAPEKLEKAEKKQDQQHATSAQLSKTDSSVSVVANNSTKSTASTTSSKAATTTTTTQSVTAGTSPTPAPNPTPPTKGSAKKNNNAAASAHKATKASTRKGRTTSASEDVSSERERDSHREDSTSGQSKPVKLSREDRKMEAILRAIEKMEKKEQKQSNRANSAGRKRGHSPTSPTKRSSANTSAELPDTPATVASPSPNTSIAASSATTTSTPPTTTPTTTTSTSFGGSHKRNTAKRRKRKNTKSGSQNSQAPPRKQRKTRTSSHDSENELPVAVTANTESDSSLRTSPVTEIAAPADADKQTPTNCDTLGKRPAKNLAMGPSEEAPSKPLKQEKKEKHEEEAETELEVARPPPAMTPPGTKCILKTPKKASGVTTPPTPPTPGTPVSSTCKLVEAAVRTFDALAPTTALTALDEDSAIPSTSSVIALTGTLLNIKNIKKEEPEQSVAEVMATMAPTPTEQLVATAAEATVSETSTPLEALMPAEASTPTASTDFKYPTKTKTKKVLMTNWLQETELTVTPSKSPPPAPQTKSCAALAAEAAAAITSFVDVAYDYSMPKKRRQSSQDDKPSTSAAALRPQCLNLAAKRVEDFITQSAFTNNLAPAHLLSSIVQPPPPPPPLTRQRTCSSSQAELAQQSSAALSSPIQVSTCSNNSSVKKRWLRQAISEETDDVACTPTSSHAAATASPTAPPLHNGFNTPLKKRRLVITGKNELGEQVIPTDYSIGQPPPPLSVAKAAAAEYQRLYQPNYTPYVPTEEELDELHRKGYNVSAYTTKYDKFKRKCSESEYVDVGTDANAAQQPQPTQPMQTALPTQPSHLPPLTPATQQQQISLLKTNTCETVAVAVGQFKEEPLEAEDSNKCGDLLEQEDDVDILRSPSPGQMMVAEDNLVKIEPEDTTEGADDVKIDVEREESNAGDKFEEMLGIKQEEQPQQRVPVFEAITDDEEEREEKHGVNSELPIEAQLELLETSNSAPVAPVTNTKLEREIKLEPPDEPNSPPKTPVTTERRKRSRTSHAFKGLLAPAESFENYSNSFLEKLTAASAAAKSPPSATKSSDSISNASSPPNSMKNNVSISSPPNSMKNNVSSSFSCSSNSCSPFGMDSKPNDQASLTPPKLPSTCSVSASVSGAVTKQNENKNLSEDDIHERLHSFHKENIMILQTRNRNTKSNSHSPSSPKSKTRSKPKGEATTKHDISKIIGTLPQPQKAGTSSTSSSSHSSSGGSKKSSSSSSHKKERNNSNNSTSSSSSNSRANSKSKHAEKDRDKDRKAQHEAIVEANAPSKPTPTPPPPPPPPPVTGPVFTTKRRQLNFEQELTKDMHLAKLSPKHRKSRKSNRPNDSEAKKQRNSGIDEHKPPKDEPTMPNKRPTTPPITPSTPNVPIEEPLPIPTITSSNLGVPAVVSAIPTVISTDQASRQPPLAPERPSFFHAAIPSFNNIVTLTNNYQFGNNYTSCPVPDFSIPPPNMIGQPPACLPVAYNSGDGLPEAVRVPSRPSTPTTPTPQNSPPPRILSAPTASPSMYPSMPYYRTVYGKLHETTTPETPLTPQQQQPYAYSSLSSTPTTPNTSLPLTAAPSSTFNSSYSKYFDENYKSSLLNDDFGCTSSALYNKYDSLKLLDAPITSTTVGAAANASTSSFKIRTKTASHDPRLNPHLNVPEPPPAPKRKLSINEYRKRMKRSSDSISSNSGKDASFSNSQGSNSLLLDHPMSSFSSKASNGFTAHADLQSSSSQGHTATDLILSGYTNAYTTSSNKSPNCPASPTSPHVSAGNSASTLSFSPSSPSYDYFVSGTLNSAEYSEYLKTLPNSVRSYRLRRRFLEEDSKRIMGGLSPTGLASPDSEDEHQHLHSSKEPDYQLDLLKVLEKRYDTIGYVHTRHDVDEELCGRRRYADLSQDHSKETDSIKSVYNSLSSLSHPYNVLEEEDENRHLNNDDIKSPPPEPNDMADNVLADTKLSTNDAALEAVAAITAASTATVATNDEAAVKEHEQLTKDKQLKCRE